MIVRTTRRAKADIRALFKLMRGYDDAASLAFLTRIDAGFRTLADHPYSGVECPELGEGVRRKIVGLTLIFYIVRPDEIVILRALDGRMDIDAEILK